ncbi:MAG: hypothetical protein AAGD92_00580 [Pseudomonadota bacterium]
MTAALRASLLQRAWRKVDIKLLIGDEMHIVRWRRRWLFDEVLFDDRRVATVRGLFSRETIFGLDMALGEGARLPLVLMIDPEAGWDDWLGEGRPRGVRLESADSALLAFGSLGADPAEPFRRLYDRAIKAFGLS